MNLTRLDYMEFARSRYEASVRRHSGTHSVSARRRKRILKRDGHVCRACGAIEKLTLDHIIPRCKGGTNVEENLQILCESCNGRKADS